MNNYNTLQLTDYNILALSLDQVTFNSKTLVNTINAYSYVLAEKDEYFKEALLEADVLLPDGVGIVAATKLLLNKKIKKIAGSDLHLFLLEQLNRESGSCFYLGSTPSTLERIKQKLAQEYPNIKAGFYSPPFSSCFSASEDEKMIEAVNNFQPDVLFIGMTAPKQEKWACLHKDALNAKVICSIGAVFDFYSGTINRPGKLWINLGLEWLGRLIHEPKRLWKRSFYYGPIFIYWIFKEKGRQVLHYFKTAIKKKRYSKNILIIGYNKVSKGIVEALETGKAGVKILGFCEEAKNVRELTPYPVLCGIDSAITASLALQVNEIYSTILPDKDDRIYQIMQRADHECIRFRFVPDFSQLIDRPVSISYVNDLPLLSLRKEPLEKLGNRLLKRMFDFFISLFVSLFILTWLIPILGLLIFLESPGPIFFTQYRSGRNKRPFRCFKLRSMFINHEANTQQATRNDPRLTKVGRFIRRAGLDEFPQFINVLIGNMSLVGPRPHMLKHTEDFSKMDQKYTVRHFIKPGITGWAQVKSYRGEITSSEQVKERAEHDVWYLEHWSLWLDIRILFLTLINKLKGEENAF